MLQARHESQHGKSPRLAVHLARDQAQVREAQRLRYRVFAEEMGARLESAALGYDEDRFDVHCDHLVVSDEDTGEVIGTYRVLAGAAAKQAGGFYSEQEFDIARLHHIRDRSVEIGRSCVHPDHRSGAVIALLWSGLATYMQARGYEHIIGCASMSMLDGGVAAASAYRRLASTCLSPAEYRVFPRCPLPLADLEQGAPARLPPLIQAYLRVGAYVCGDPAWDPDFNTADLFMLLPMARVDGRYARHFMRNAGA